MPKRVGSKHGLLVAAASVLSGCVHATLHDGPRTVAPGTVDVDTTAIAGNAIWAESNQGSLEFPPLRVRVGVADRLEVVVAHSTIVPTSLTFKYWAFRGFCDVSFGGGAHGVQNGKSFGIWPQASLWLGCGAGLIRPVLNANFILATGRAQVFSHLAGPDRVTEIDFGPGWVASVGWGLQWVLHRNFAILPIAHLLEAECTNGSICLGGRRLGGQLAIGLSFGPQR